MHAGYTTTGVPTNINVIRSLKNSMSRKIALSAPYLKQLELKQLELKNLESGMLSNCFQKYFTSSKKGRNNIHNC